MKNNYTTPRMTVIGYMSKGSLLAGSLPVTSNNATDEDGEYVDPLGREVGFYFDIKSDTDMDSSFFEDFR